MTTTEPTTIPDAEVWSYTTCVTNGKFCVTLTSNAAHTRVATVTESNYARSEKRLRKLIARAEATCAKRNAVSRTAEQVLADVTADIAANTFKNSPRVHGH
jgi:hypothetical protein